MTDEKIMFKALGRHNYVRGIVSAISGYANEVCFISPSFHDEDGFKPAETVDINGIDNIKELHSFLGELIKEHDEMNPQPPKP